MKIVITGAGGFIGGHLARHFQGKHEVIPVTRSVCDLSDAGAVKNFFEKCKTDVLIHLAASVKPGRNLEDIPDQLKKTVMPAVNVATYVPTNVKLSLFVGTCEEYGNGVAPFTEESPLIAISPYGFGKISAFHAVRMIALQRGLAWSYVRPFLTFGEAQRSDLFVPSVIRACVAGESLAMTPGDQIRDFIYVGDLCRMFERIIDKPEPVFGDVINLSAFNEMKVKDVALMIHKIVGKGDLRVGALPYRENECMRLSGRNDKFLRLYGDFKFTPMVEALERTIRSFD